MEITLLGGGNAIGASSALVAIGAHRILVDCGVRMTGDNVLPDCGLLAARSLPAVDAVVQTHADFAHSGALPILPQQSPVTPVYMTPPQALISILLQDSLRIAKSQCDAEGDLAVGNQLPVPGMPVPSTCRRPDVLAIESTYGNRLHSPRQGKVLIPALAPWRPATLLELWYGTGR